MFKRWLTVAAAVASAVLLAPAAAVAAPSWLMPQYLEGSASYSETKTAMAPDGTIVTAATRGAGDAIQVVATVRRPGQAFGPAQVLDTVPPGGLALLAGVTVSPSGQFAVAYIRTGAAAVLVSFLRPDGTFAPSIITPDNLYGATSKTSGYDAASTMYVVRPYTANDELGTVEVQRADNSRATQFFPMIGYDKNESEMAVAVAPDGTYTVLYTTQARAAGAECGTQRLYAINGTATALGTPQLLAERAPVIHPAGSVPACSVAAIGGVSVLRLADGTLLAAYDEVSPNPSGAEGTQQITLVSRTPGATTWSAPQRFPHAYASVPSYTKLTLAGTTPVLTTYNRVEGVNSASVRRADGGWTTPRAVGPADRTEAQAGVIGLPDGSAQVVWSDLADRDAFARTLAADGTFTAEPRLLIANYANISLSNDGMAVATDGKGNGVLAGVSATGVGAAPLIHVPFDGAAPVLTDLAVPAAGRAGTPLSFSTTAFDVWSDVTLAWNYGDGTTGAGGEHTYANAGQFPVSVTATDAVGNTSTKSGTSTITAPPIPAPGPGPQPARDTTAPRFTTKKVTPKKPTVKKAATLSFGLSEAATVTAVVQQKTAGVKRTAKGKCAKAPKVRPKGAKRCTLLVTRTTKKGAFKVGTGSIKLPKTLKAGSYTIALTATDAAGNRGTATVAFTVRKAKAKR